MQTENCCFIELAINNFCIDGNVFCTVLMDCIALSQTQWPPKHFILPLIHPFTHSFIHLHTYSVVFTIWFVLSAFGFLM